MENQSKTTEGEPATDDIGLSLRRRRSDKRFTCGAWAIGFAIVPAAVSSVYFEGAWPNNLHPDVNAGIVVLSVGLGIAAFWAYLCALFGRVRWHCPGCGKMLDSEQAWQCGFCDRHNYGSSILGRCLGCKARPPGYRCHHAGCGVITRFETNADERHPARAINHEDEPHAGETPEQALARRQQELAEKRHEIDRLKHEAEIRNLTQQAERLRRGSAVGGADAAMEEQLERALERLKTGMRAVARSKHLQAQLDEEIVTNAPRLSPEDVERLRDYAKRQFEGYREDIALGRYDQ